MGKLKKEKEQEGATGVIRRKDGERRGGRKISKVAIATVGAMAIASAPAIA
jgi:hypothetical protein